MHLVLAAPALSADVEIFQRMRIEVDINIFLGKIFLERGKWESVERTKLELYKTCIYFLKKHTYLVSKLMVENALETMTVR